MGKYSKQDMVVRNAEEAAKFMNEYRAFGGNRNARRKLGLTVEDVQFLERMIWEDQKIKLNSDTSTSSILSLNNQL
jgi:hypothetical protein